MREILSGCIVMGASTSALFFFTFWRRTADRLFLLMGIAFLIMAVNGLFLGLASPSGEGSVPIYISRLVDFGLVAAAVVDKNRS
jgi:hypothetical protein